MIVFIVIVLQGHIGRESVNSASCPPAAVWCVLPRCGSALGQPSAVSDGTCKHSLVGKTRQADCVGLESVWGGGDS